MEAIQRVVPELYIFGVHLPHNAKNKLVINVYEKKHLLPVNTNRMIIIQEWYGRNGNNIMQLIHAIFYAQIYRHKQIQFPVHDLLTATTIQNDWEDLVPENETVIKGQFFHIEKEFNLCLREPYIKKKIFLQYIKPIFTLLPSNRYPATTNTLFIHIRSGDLFEPNPHSGYVQPPLCYYTNAIGKYESIVAVCEDDRNPCASYLKHYPHVQYESNDVRTDLSLLYGIKHFMMGLGIFSMLVYWMNEHLETLYIPRYVVEKQMGLNPDLPLNWGPNIQVHIIDLPGYIPCGSWVNSLEQRLFMIDYSIPKT